MRAKSPWLFIPSLYFQQGLPVILVQQFSVLLYKKLGVANEQILLWTSLLAWPWIIKMLWGPLVDLTSTKRSWVFSMQVAIALALVALALAVKTKVFFPLTLGILLVLAFLSATHDIALDGYYLIALKKNEQAFFLGFCSTFFRLAMVFCTGALVIFAGLWEERGVATVDAWRRTLFVGALVYGVLVAYAGWAMPIAAEDKPALAPSKDFAPAAYFEAFKTFFAQDKAIAVLLFILLYRFGESMVWKTSGLFMLDSRAAGGLGFDTVQTGAVLGSAGVVALVLGGMLGGMAVARFGLRRCLWPMAIMMHVPNLMYVWAAYAQPGTGSMYFIVAVDQFAYGFGLASYMVYTMYICQATRFQTSHYAIVTALMAAGAMLAGILSGYLQNQLGYFWFFICVCVLTIPGMILLNFIPLEQAPVAAT
ncbi:MAG: MFS transporter [Deltaproteobacteria bacterium]|nr:MFS transporter [Deltaproteobacteria bacterium]